MRILIAIGFIFLSLSISFSQERTVGLLSYDQSKSYEGYTLLFPHGNSITYLINNCGELVHEWAGVSGFLPGNSAYLTEKGELIRCIRNFNHNSDPIWAGGGGEIVEALDWDGNLLWSFEQNDSLKRIHHDIEVMPNGNILMISWEKKFFEECVSQGRDPENINHNNLLPDYILEYNPILDSVVWEWHTWDHLIQDFDNSKENFGIVNQHPEKVDINYENNLGNSDWLHTNAIDYNPGLDQIILSIPHFDEIWIIDHSTTTEEASSITGGRSGKGGDLLFRWGNPLTYKRGNINDQKLFFQHDAQWVNDFVDPNDPLFNKILLFNNRFNEEYSVVNVLDPEFAADSVNYILADNKFLPTDYLITKEHPQPDKLFSTGLSSAQILPNGNYLILSGRFGYIFELTPDDEIVWEYKVPISNGVAVEQGTELGINQNINFRVKRYPLDYVGFEGKDLSPKGVLQIEDEDDLCNRIVASEEITETINFDLFPNPTQGLLNIKIEYGNNVHFSLFNLDGQRVKSVYLTKGDNAIDLGGLPAGIYMAQIGTLGNKRLVKID